MGEVTVKGLLNAGVIIPPYPVATNAIVFSGDRAVAPHLHCKGICKDPVCRLQPGKLMMPLVCPHGLSYYKAKADGEVVTVYGVIDKGRSDKGSTAAKATSKAGRLIVRSQDVLRWLEYACAAKRTVGRMLQESEEQGGAKAVARVLHDAPVMVRRAEQSLDRMLRNNRGVLQESREMKVLRKTLRMTSDVFAVAQIWANPESASFGQKRESEIHKLLHAIVFNTNMDQQPARVKFQGTCFLKLGLHDSFNLLPLMLVRNAVKYSVTLPSVVKIEETGDDVRIAVSSYGPLIEDDERSLIFDRDARGKWAEKHTTKGEGVGLYVAQIIALAHETKIIVESTPDGKMRNGIPMAHNEFSFVLHKAG